MARQNTPHTIVMWGAYGLGALSVLTVIGLFVTMAVAFSWAIFTAAILMVIVTVALVGTGAVFMDESEKKSTESVFGSTAEAEILSGKQKKKLKTARAEVLMDLAMTDVEKERENIEHRRMQEAGDMTLPPHKTTFTNPDGSPKQLGGR